MINISLLKEKVELLEKEVMQLNEEQKITSKENVDLKRKIKVSKALHKDEAPMLREIEKEVGNLDKIYLQLSRIIIKRNLFDQVFKSQERASHAKDGRNILKLARFFEGEMKDDINHIWTMIGEIKKLVERREKQNQDAMTPKDKCNP